MKLCSLYVRNFRCYEEAFFEFDPHLTTICGGNARGKTTVLEAIFFLISGRSFRNAQTGDMIRREASYYYLEASFEKNGLHQNIKISGTGAERKIVYNSTTYPSSTSLLGLLKGVVISPDDAALVKGGPALRRHYLDLQIAQVDPLYVHHLTRFNRATRQRNHLLRSKHCSAIESWEHEMATSSAYVTQQRALSTLELQTDAQRLHTALSGDPVPMALSYKSSSPAQADPELLRQYYLEQYHKNRRRESELGFTLVGPHKDDLLIALGDKEVRYFASEGQQRSCVAALKLAEWERMRRVSEEVPLMLIDDVGTSLDESRRGLLFRHVEQLGQVFLTATAPLPLSGKMIAI